MTVKQGDVRARSAAYRQGLDAQRSALADVLADPRAAQREVLLECVMPNVETVFGREHGFGAIRTIDDFRRAVPIRTYDEISSYVEREAEGEAGVLTVERPLVFARTSGTTGAAKKIPHKERDARRRRALRMAEEADFVANFPEAEERVDAALSLILDWKAPSTFTKSGVPHIGMSTWAPPEAAELPTWFLAPWFRLPAEPSDYAERLYVRLRHAVEADLRFISALNPSTLLVVARELAEALPRLVRELHDGTVRGEAVLTPNPSRARALESLAGGGAISPAQVWPNLRGISCWTAGATALYLPAVQKAYGEGVAITPCGIIASEAFVTITAYSAGARLGGLLAVATHFFEFAPVASMPDPRETLLAHELEVGQDYVVVLTQQSGLYRYAIGDVVRCVAKVGDVPRLEFLERYGTVASFTGEKLTEPQVIAAVGAATKTLAVAVGHFTCFPVWGEPPHYTFAVETENALGPERAAALAEAIDTALGAHNDEYPSKRSSGRLGPARVLLLKPGTFLRHWSRGLASAAIPTQLKQKVLEKRGQEAVLEELRRSSDG